MKLSCIIVLSLLSLPIIEAQFGLGNKNRKDNNGNNGGDPNVGEEKIDLAKDPELLAAMEIFAGMSPEEMEDTMKDLVGMLGDDPETLAAIEEVMKETQNMKASDVQSSLNQMVSDDEIAAATQDALRLLGKSNWETIWGKQDLILDAVIQSGQISADDAASFKSDNAAWKAELNFIWNELQKQAATAAKNGDEL